ncbi:MAG: hypothetical protein K6F42_01910 [Bacteroidales bacterium]|nr:hypothetical protein [Bacteroidales bacterium]
MRRLFIVAAAMFASLALAQAQVTISPGNSAMEFQVKRALAQGDDVIIDLMITCKSNQSVFQLFELPGIYDDEGNFYTTDVFGTKLQFEFDGKRSTTFRFPIERGIQRKMRIIVHNVDEYASAFSLIKISYMGDNSGFSGELTIKNLPITRN